MDMLTASLELVRSKLNAALQAAEHRADDWGILAGLVDQHGAAFEPARGKLAMTVINVMLNGAASSAPVGPATGPMRTEPIVAFVANFDNQHYSAGLNALSRTINFFHQSPVL